MRASHRLWENVATNWHHLLPTSTGWLKRLSRSSTVSAACSVTSLTSCAQGVQKSEFDLALLVREISDDADFETRNRKRSVKLQSVKKCTIIGNEQLLRRAIENVVRNAVLYSAENTEVEVKLDCLDGR